LSDFAGKRAKSKGNKDEKKDACIWRGGLPVRGD